MGFLCYKHELNPYKKNLLCHLKYDHKLTLILILYLNRLGSIITIKKETPYLRCLFPDYHIAKFIVAVIPGQFYE